MRNIIILIISFFVLSCSSNIKNDIWPKDYVKEGDNIELSDKLQESIQKAYDCMYYNNTKLKSKRVDKNIKWDNIISCNSFDLSKVKDNIDLKDCLYNNSNNFKLVSFKDTLFIPVNKRILENKEVFYETVATFKEGLSHGNGCYLLIHAYKDALHKANGNKLFSLSAFRQIYGFIKEDQLIVLHYWRSKTSGKYLEAKIYDTDEKIKRFFHLKKI